MIRRIPAVTAAAAVVALTAAGCSTSSEDKPADPTAAVRKTARTFQEAVIARDWPTACKLRTERMRGGTVAECVADRPTPSPSAPSEDPAASPSGTPSSAEPPEPPEPSESAESAEPPTYADGSTMEPIASPTSSRPDRAETGPVRATDVTKVPASDDHRAGYGVLVAYSVKWPGKTATTTRYALRLVRVDGAWRVEQRETVNEADPDVRTALTGR